tara:strand:- start:3873 stop:4628 length:756 start_codon:yes stop_codon:yes gene_type:complete
MSSKQPPRVQFNFAPDPQDIQEPEVQEDIDEETGEENPNFIYDDDIPKVTEKPKIDETEIFQIEEEAKQELPDDLKEEMEKIKQPVKKPVKQVIKEEQPQPQKKKRKPMSEAHKAKLALARQKANEARSKKAIERKKMQEIERQTKELQKKKKEKDLEELKEQVEKPVSKKVETQQNNSTISKEDIEKIQLDAIMKYETLRKARKAEKREKEKLEAQQNELLRKINPQQQQRGYRARDSNGRLLNRYDMCY